MWLAKVCPSISPARCNWWRPPTRARADTATIASSRVRARRAHLPDIGAAFRAPCSIVSTCESMPLASPPTNWLAPGVSRAGKCKHVWRQPVPARTPEAHLIVTSDGLLWMDSRGRKTPTECWRRRRIGWLSPPADGIECAGWSVRSRTWRAPRRWRRGTSRRPWDSGAAGEPQRQAPSGYGCPPPGANPNLVGAIRVG